MKDDNNNKGSSEFSEVAKGLSMILQIGINMMVPIGLCFFIGYKLDEWLQTSYLVIIFLLLGIAAGARSVYDLTKSFYAKDLKKENAKRQYYEELYREREKNLSKQTAESDEE